MENFLFAVRADLPILITILCGTVFSSLVKWDKIHYKKLNVIVFRFLLPIQLFYSVYTIESITSVNWKMLGYFMIATLICIGMGVAVACFSIKKREQKPVIIQASFRTNIAVIGSSLVTAICTDTLAESMALTSLAICASSVINNIAAVIVLRYYSSETVNGRTILKGVVTNPLVIGSLAGLACLLVRELFMQNIPFRLETSFPSLFKVISNFYKASSPMALFCLGAQLDFKAGKTMLREISLGVTLRLVLCPAVVIGLAFLLKGPLSLTTVETPALIAFAASPLAVSSAIMVQEMGGDHQLANHLVVWSSVFSMISLFIIIFLMRSLGWL